MRGEEWKAIKPKLSVCRQSRLHHASHSAGNTALTENEAILGGIGHEYLTQSPSSI